MSGTSTRAGRPRLLHAGHRQPAVGQHDRRLAGIGGRRDPGVEARLGALGQRAQAEGRPQPVGGAVADHDGEQEHAEQEHGAQREGIAAVGARRRNADPQAAQRLGKPPAVHLPQRGRAVVLGAVAERVLVGGGRAVRHTGDALHASDGLLPGWPAHAQQRDDGAGESQAEQPQDDLVRQLRQSRPQAGERHQDEQPGNAEQQPGARPDLLEEQRQLAEQDLALEGAFRTPVNLVAC